MAGSKQKQANAHKAATPVLEWLLGLVGVALLLACVGFLVYEGMGNDERPGAISASVKEIIGAGGMHIVTFELRNAGSQTLSNVHVTARLIDGEREVERAQTVIDYLPGHSALEGGFYFRNDPKSFRLQIAPQGYQKP